MHPGRFVTALIFSLLVTSMGHAEPMLAPTREAACRSLSIVAAKYVSWMPLRMGIPDYFDPPAAVFEVTENLAGEPVSGTILVRYDFHDGSACMEPSDWSFSESRMPAADSGWILYLESKLTNQDTYTTYRGDYGRRANSQREWEEAIACRR